MSDTQTRPYEPIETPEESEEPTNPAHTDLPGPGGGGPADSAADPALERAGGESRRRREEAHFDLDPDQADAEQ